MHNTITRKQSQTPRCIVVRSTPGSYIHYPRSHLGFSLYSLGNIAELFYTGITTLTHCGFSTETHKPTWFFTGLTNNPLWFFNRDPQTKLVFHGLTKNPGGFTRRPTNQLGFSRANQKPWWFYTETHQPIQEKIKSKQLKDKP